MQITRNTNFDEINCSRDSSEAIFVPNLGIEKRKRSNSPHWGSPDITKTKSSHSNVRSGLILEWTTSAQRSVFLSFL